ncbi:hypothetical protein DPMN_076379 [Dreissena polymorpha]|uniref:Uncharacterized protein n=1 Tax=Dreissena polymorpha TaxID=45954 RepID=A0A9D3YM54_DREPO|nr:hypothetical protein DPMN_076379 [Dreissena polymorpha]
MVFELPSVVGLSSVIGLSSNHHYWTNSMASICLRIVNARVFTNQKWTDGRRKRQILKPHLSNQTDRQTDRQTDGQCDHFMPFFGGIKMRVFTRLLYSLIRKTAPPPGGHFHDDWARNVTSRVLTNFFYYKNIRTCPPPGSHVFQRTGPIFELYSLSTKFLYSQIRKTAPPTGSHLLTKFHEDRTRNVASIVITNKCGRTDDRQKTDNKSSPEQSGDLKSKTDSFLKSVRRKKKEDSRDSIVKTI